MGFEIFIYQPVANLLKIPASSLIFSNQLKNLGEILVHRTPLFAYGI